MIISVYMLYLGFRKATIRISHLLVELKGSDTVILMVTIYDRERVQIIISKGKGKVQRPGETKP